MSDVGFADVWFKKAEKLQTKTRL